MDTNGIFVALGNSDSPLDVDGISVFGGGGIAVFDGTGTTIIVGGGAGVFDGTGATVFVGGGIAVFDGIEVIAIVGDSVSVALTSVTAEYPVGFAAGVLVLGENVALNTTTVTLGNIEALGAMVATFVLVLVATLAFVSLGTTV